MKRINYIFAGLCLSSTFIIAGCGGDVVKDVEALADKTCACEDMECVETQKEAMRGLRDKYEKPSKGDLEKISKVRKRMRKCASDLEDKLEKKD